MIGGAPLVLIKVSSLKKITTLVILFRTENLENKNKFKKGIKLITLKIFIV